MQRFFDKIVIQTNNCWQWTGAVRGKSGYGAFKVKGKVIDAHRVSWELHFSTIPVGQYVCHKCDNRLCVNPAHLFLATQKVNMQDCVAKNRISRRGNPNTNAGVLPVNARLSKVEVQQVKEKIRNRTDSLKELAKELQLPYQLVRDLNCGRVYK